MRVSPARSGLLAVMVAAALASGGCTRLRSHQGYIIDTDLVNAVQPGVDNRQSVLQTLGTPTLTSQFDQSEWYYVARDSRNLAFQNPRARDQLTLKISFAPDGTVRAISRGNLAQVVGVDPYGKTTPTLGRKRGFLEDLFGNIGTVGAAGTGAGAGGGNTGP